MSWGGLCCAIGRVWVWATTHRPSVACSWPQQRWATKETKFPTALSLSQPQPLARPDTGRKGDSAKDSSLSWAYPQALPGSSATRFEYLREQSICRHTHYLGMGRASFHPAYYSFQPWPSAGIAWKRKGSRNDSLPHLESKEKLGSQDVLLHSYKRDCRLEMFG